LGDENQTINPKEGGRADMKKFADLTPEEFDDLVKAEVDKHLSSREEAEARKEAEEALKEAREVFETLKANLEAKDAKIREYEDVLANIDLDPTATEVAANEKIVELENSVEEWKHRAEVAEAALETLAREETTATRMSELEENGVALEDEAAEAQYAKVREMSDEDFTSYKSELIALKSKYAPASEEDKEEEIEVAELDETEINMIAQSLGCDPSDAKCISLVREVAAKVAEVSNLRKGNAVKTEEPTEVKTETLAEEPQKETAAVKDQKLSLGEAITRSMNQEIQAPVGLKEECSQAWEGYYASKRGEKKSE
jgi:hypothetical protein